MSVTGCNVIDLVLRGDYDKGNPRTVIEVQEV